MRRSAATRAVGDADVALVCACVVCPAHFIHHSEGQRSRCQVVQYGGDTERLMQTWGPKQAVFNGLISRYHLYQKPSSSGRRTMKWRVRRGHLLCLREARW
ncbi:hypothetical protein L917_11207 [Phytophthora nicotianae]|uniref:Uncharacterized protein n=1 Tax=Phytophthora nicotianae TaxID=4792 RepID=W2KZC5_PHYNI|nr:hypothetical protein L917_11207 [Phytophthora nicotianae]